MATRNHSTPTAAGSVDTLGRSNAELIKDSISALEQAAQHINALQSASDRRRHTIARLADRIIGTGIGSLSVLQNEIDLILEGGVGSPCSEPDLDVSRETHPRGGNGAGGAPRSFLTVPSSPEQTVENCQRIVQLLQYIDSSSDGMSKTAEMGQYMLLQELDHALAGLCDRFDGDAA